MKTILERYQSESEAREVTAPSGYVFVVRGATRIDFGEVLGAVPSLVHSNGKMADQKTIQARQEAIYRNTFEKYVDGIKDPETGDVVPVPYEMVLANDVPVICEFALARGGLGTDKAAQVGRSL